MDDAAFEMVGNVAVFRLDGGHGLVYSVQVVKQVIERVKQAGVGKLMIDVTAIDFGPPSIVERHWLMTEWAAAGRSAVRVALVVRPEFRDPQRFGTAVARNHGLMLKAFSADEPAMVWLQDRG